MKAVVLEKFGGPEELKIKDVPTPEPLENEVQIQVRYASVNPVDWKIREGYLKDVLPHHFPIILGWDAAGIVSAVGNNVRDFRVGDRVHAYCRKPSVQMGTYAEYVCMDRSAVAELPETLSFAEGACIPLVGLTAWQALFDAAKLKAEQTVLVLGGAGGVGGMALQFARNAGATVATTASFSNHGYVRELGAEHIIDYRERNVGVEVRRLFPEGVDVILDCVGGTSLKDAYPLVKKGGALISIVDTPDNAVAARLGFRAAYHFVSPSGDQLRQIDALFADNRALVPAIEEMRLEDVAQAHLRNQTRRQRGKLALRI